jgi:TP901 family phage tail tape measure protein
MAVFDLASAIVRLRLDTAAFDAGISRVLGGLQSVTGSISRVSPLMSAALGGAAVAAVGAAGALGATVKVAGDLEAQYTTLRRVTGLSADETKRLADNLKGIAATKAGISLQEINKVAEFAARQGIGGDTAGGKIQGITAVTSALADLKLVINDMDVETASTEMLRALKVFGQGPDKIQAFASALVGIDNASTATAPELLTMVQYLSGTAAAAGASIPHILALSGVIKDVGVSSEVGTSAVVRLMQKMQTDVHGVAAAVGLDARKLGAAMADDPVKGVTMFLAALRKLSGSDQTAALKGLHMQGIRTAPVLQQISAGLKDVDRFMKIADGEWETQKSLQEGVALSSRTVWAQWSLLSNQATLLAAKVGEYTLPAFAEFLGLVGDVGAAIGSLADAGSSSLQWLSDAAVAAIRWMRGAFAGLVDSIRWASDIFAVIRETWPGLVEEAGLQIVKSWKIVGYTFDWVVNTAISAGEYLFENWQVLFSDLAQLVTNWQNAVTGMMIETFKGVADIVPKMSRELFKFAADPLHFTTDVDFAGDIAKTFAKATARFSPDVLLGGMAAPGFQAPAFRPEDAAKEEQALIDALRANRVDEAMGILIARDRARKAPAGPPKEAMRVAAAAAGAAGPPGGGEMPQAGQKSDFGSIGLAEYRQKLQSSILAADTPKQQLAEARRLNVAVRQNLTKTQELFLLAKQAGLDRNETNRILKKLAEKPVGRVGLNN